jgi:hypothetical protein
MRPKAFFSNLLRLAGAEMLLTGTNSLSNF